MLLKLNWTTGGAWLPASEPLEALARTPVPTCWAGEMTEQTPGHGGEHDDDGPAAGRPREAGPRRPTPDGVLDRAGAPDDDEDEDDE